jgi:hypothetical protein
MLGQMLYTITLVIVGIFLGANLRRFKSILIRYILKKKIEVEEKNESKDEDKKNEEEYDFEDEDLKMVPIIKPNFIRFSL